MIFTKNKKGFTLNVFWSKFSLILGIFIISSKTQALVAPEVYCTELNLAKNNFQPSEEIQGTVSLWNYENFIVSDLRFYFQLLGKEINGLATEMIDEKIGKEIFSLSAGFLISFDLSQIEIS